MCSSAASFGAPVTEPGGNVAAMASAQPQPGRRRPSTVRHEVDEARVVLDGEQGGHLDRAEVAHPAEVVAHEVDDHHVLGAVLGGEAARVGRRALDGRGLDDVAVARRNRSGDADATWQPTAGSRTTALYGAGLPSASAAPRAATSRARRAAGRTAGG